MNMWDVRFGGKDFFYGREPNIFFKEFLSGQTKTGKLLLPAEGEGRNAVYAAKLGWDVHAFDNSKVAREKTLKFAKDEGVSVNYTLQDIAGYVPESGKYDLIALIFVHLPEGMRKEFHQKMVQSLKPGGIILVESFAKEQINNSSGGPQDINMLFSKEIMKNDFSELVIKKLIQEQAFLDEGHHHGKADLVRFIGEKV
jgi:SAM-dependent methyltransferase